VRNKDIIEGIQGIVNVEEHRSDQLGL